MIWYLFGGVVFSKTMDLTNTIEVATAALARTRVISYFRINDFFVLYIKINEFVSFQKLSGIFDSTSLRNYLLPS